MKQPHINTDRHTKFLDKIIEINKDQTKDTYHICDLILNFYVGLSKVWLDYSLCKKDNDRLHEKETLHNLVQTQLCNMEEAGKI